MGNDDQPHPRGCLQFLQQTEYLGLDGDIERRGRLIGDQELRTTGDRHGDHHALAHATGHLMRVVVKPALGVGNPHLPQELDRAVAGFLARDVGVTPDCLDQLISDGNDRIERCHRILEDHRDVLAPHPLHLSVGQGSEVTAHEADGTADNPCGRFRQQAHHRQRRERLATSGLTDDRHGLAGPDRQRQPVDRRQHAAPREQRNL
jgi:hypothetical protein